MGGFVSMSESIDNGFGVNFPTENMAQMVELFGVKAGDRVLDVGGGAAPFIRADVIVDYDLQSGYHRDQYHVSLDERWLAADIQQLPFADKAFDFVYCSHVLEHVTDPEKACKELMRVAHRGYFETPRKLTELLHGHPTHRWLVDTQGEKLIFEPRCFVESPLQNFALAHILNYPQTLDRFLTQYRNISCVQVLWEGNFEYEVRAVPSNHVQFDYADQIQAAWSHFYFALNLMANHAPVAYVLPHIEVACKLRGGETESVFYTLLGCAQMIEGNETEARLKFGQALQLDVGDLVSKENLYRLDCGDFSSVLLPKQRGEYSLQGMRIEYLQEKVSALEEKLEIYEHSKYVRLRRFIHNLFNK